jgi:hypothetical protein
VTKLEQTLARVLASTAVTPGRRDAVFVDNLWNRFKGSLDKPYMFQPRAKRGIEEKILARVVADQIQPEVWITSKLGERHPDFSGRPIDGVARPGENLVFVFFRCHLPFLIMNSRD